MSDDIILPLPEEADPDMMAAELALGLLEGDARATALRRVLVEPGFAQDVETWRAMLGRLFGEWPEVSPPGAVFARIERSIEVSPQAQMPQDIVVRPNRWWPAAMAVTSAAAAAMLVVIVLRPMPTPPLPAPVASAPPAAMPAAMLVAAIDPVEKGAPVNAVYDSASGVLRVGAGALANADQSAELWIIGADATPHSLGILRADSGSAFTVSTANRAQIAAGATLAVSLEVIGGSPTGKPAGPVVATGKLSQV